MESTALISGLDHLEAIVVDSGGSIPLRILSRFAEVCCDVPHDAMNDPDILAGVGSALTTESKSRRQPPVRLSVTLTHDPAVDEQTCRGVVALAECLAPSVVASVALDYDQCPVTWDPLLKWVARVREGLSRPRELAIQLHAPFDEFRESEMEALFNLGVRIEFTAGWKAGLADDEHLAPNPEVLRKFAEFGFRAVVRWYVHAGNLAHIEANLPDILLENYCSGFSLPLVSASPYYRFASDFPRLPGASDYRRLLLQAYGEYPYYDDVFYPLNSLSLLIRAGGRNSDLGLPTELNLIMDSDGGIGLYRQSPSLAIHWTDVSSVLAMSPDALRRSILDFAAETWRWEKNKYCGGCQWRHTCGGLDAFAAGHPETHDLDTMCKHRMLFLEHFARARAPDYVFGNKANGPDPDPKAAAEA